MPQIELILNIVIFSNILIFVGYLTYIAYKTHTRIKKHIPLVCIGSIWINDVYEKNPYKQLQIRIVDVKDGYCKYIVLTEFQKLEVTSSTTCKYIASEYSLVKLPHS